MKKYSGWSIIAIAIVTCGGLLFSLVSNQPAIGQICGIGGVLLTVAIWTQQNRESKRIVDDLRSMHFNEVLLRIASKIQQNTRLGLRMTQDTVAKKRIGPALAHTGVDDSNLLEYLLFSKRVFIESGSTYAYLADYLQTYTGDSRNSSKPPQHVYTNNILVRLSLLFDRRCRVRLLEGTGDDKYGATYGMDFEPGARLNVNRQELCKFLEGRKSTENTELILMAASKIHLESGPHVGSERNATFKQELVRYAKRHKVPVVVAVSENRIEHPATTIRPGCYLTHPTDKDVRISGIESFATDIASGAIFLIISVANAPRSEVGLLTQVLAPKGVMQIQLGDDENKLIALIASDEPKWKTSKELRRAIANRTLAQFPQKGKSS